MQLSNILKYQFITLVFLGITISSVAQQYDPFDGNANAYHAKLSRYFKSPAEEISSRKQFAMSIKAFADQPSWSLASLPSQLDNYQKLLAGLKKHQQYFRLAGYINNKDTASRSAYREVNQLMNMLSNKLTNELQRPELSLTPAQDFSNAKLDKYAYLIKQNKENRAHDLSPRDEQLVTELSDDMLGSLTDRYDDLMDEIKAPDMLTNDGKKLNPIKDRGVILKSNDPELRKTGAIAYNMAYSKHADLLAATLIDITKQRSALAKVRDYGSAPARSYGRKLQLTEESVKKLLEEMTQYAPVLKAYQQLQATKVGQVAGLDNVHSWDLYIPLGYSWEPKSYRQVRKLILTSLAPLGKEYIKEFDWLLDAKNGALEIAAGPNRVNENTAVGFPGVPTTLYMKAYNGSLGDVLRLSHEGGHAIHSQLMNNLAVPTYSSGPSFLFEAYAMLNELLMLDQLQKEAPTAKVKAYYTRQFLDKLSHEIFTSAQEGSFEQGLYDGVVSGKIKTRKDVDSLYGNIMNKYDIFFANEPDRGSEWINKRLLFDDPLYNVNYLYAILVSCKLYTELNADPKGFGIKYTALLKNGFDAPAEELLKKYMGFGLDHEALLKSTLQLMKDKTAELEKLYSAK